MNRLLQDFRDTTEDTARGLARLRRRVALSSGAEPRSSRDVLSAIPEVGPGAVGRLARRPATPHPRRWRFAVVVALGVTTLWVGRPTEEGELSQTLDLVSSQPEDLAWSPEVGLVYSGTGQVSGTRRTSYIRWDFGTLAIQVRPEAGVTLEVETPEARVVVVGTAFQVTRDTLGTEVTVESGTVVLTCLDRGLVHSLSAPGRGSCLPDRPSGLLGRARALRRGDVEGALAAVEEGLSRSSSPDPIRGELLALKAEICLATGRNLDATEAARTYLDEGYTIRADALRALIPAQEQRP